MEILMLDKLSQEQITCFLTGSTQSHINLILDDLRTILNERQYTIVEMKYNKYKNIEIAEKLNVSPATITQEFRKIRNKLIEKGVDVI